MRPKSARDGNTRRITQRRKRSDAARGTFFAISG